MEIPWASDGKRNDQTMRTNGTHVQTVRNSTTTTKNTERDGLS